MTQGWTKDNGEVIQGNPESLQSSLDQGLFTLQVVLARNSRMGMFLWSFKPIFDRANVASAGSLRARRTLGDSILKTWMK